MSMFHTLHLFTVHTKPERARMLEEAKFVREGFNIWAFAFHLLWLFYNRLWLQLAAIAAYVLFASVLVKMGYLSFDSGLVLEFAARIICGFYGNDWQRAKLKRQGYIFTDVSAGNNLLAAQQRYLERALGQQRLA